MLDSFNNNKNYHQPVIQTTTTTKKIKKQQLFICFTRICIGLVVKCNKKLVVFYCAICLERNSTKKKLYQRVSVLQQTAPQVSNVYCTNKNNDRNIE